jgi:23S rRNA pseudouridine2605 synthase
MTIGRLDINTEGLLLLTNDGGLARVLELPATGWLRRYRVRVHGKVDEKALADLKDGTAVDGVFYGGIEAALDREQGSNAWLTIGLREGKNREVKNILGALGLDVTRLIRLSYGPFQLGELAEGAVQELRGRMLREQLGDRLIEEAGANFDAPVAVPFSNKPVSGEPEPRPDFAEKPRIVRDGVQGRIGEGGLIKGRRRERDRDGDRTNALSKLTTKPDRPSFKKEGGFKKDAGFSKGPKPAFGGRGDKGKPDERYEPPKVRTSNVWMAPGARPQGKKSAGASDKPDFKPRERGEGSGAPRPRGGKPGFGKGKSGADRRR